MSVKVLIFGTDDLYPTLKQFYEAEVQKGNLKIVAYSIFENGALKFFSSDTLTEKIKPDNLDFNFVIISSQKNFYLRMKFFEGCGIPRQRIIDGRVFQIPNFDFPKFLSQSIAYGVVENFSYHGTCIYPKIYKIKNTDSEVRMGVKSYISEGKIDGEGVITAGNFVAMAWGITFELGLNNGHNFKHVAAYETTLFDWAVPPGFYVLPNEPAKIEIGSDVWIGRGCILKSTNLEKPLQIGDGAVIASDSVVVKNVPPYAIVGGNPAKIIKYRFSEQIIESLLRIKWWDWDIDKIYENFKYFNDIEKFVELHDKGA